MRIEQIFLATLVAFLPLQSVVAQDIYPSVSPTATYMNEDGNEATADEDNPSFYGQAPLEVTFHANPSNMFGFSPTYEWHFRMEGESTDQFVRYEEDTQYTFTNAGTTHVTLYVNLGTDTLQLDSIAFHVTISESKLSFPNAFSPNGDSYNEVFKAKEYQSLVEFHAYIFNRWGQKLFEWTDPSQGWDGTHNGNPVKEGVYFVLVKAKGADGREYNIRKDVNLLRGFTEGTSKE